MKVTKIINYLKWLFAFAVFGVAAYAIYQAVQSAKNVFKPSGYAKDPVQGQTKIEKAFPNISEAVDVTKDAVIEFFKPSEYAKDPVQGQTQFEKSFPNVSEIWDKITDTFSSSKSVTAIPKDAPNKMIATPVFEKPAIVDPLPIANFLTPAKIITDTNVNKTISPPVQVYTAPAQVIATPKFLVSGKTSSIVVPTIVKNGIVNNVLEPADIYVRKRER